MELGERHLPKSDKEPNSIRPFDQWRKNDDILDDDANLSANSYAKKKDEREGGRHYSPERRVRAHSDAEKRDAKQGDTIIANLEGEFA